MNTIDMSQNCITIISDLIDLINFIQAHKCKDAYLDSIKEFFNDLASTIKEYFPTNSNLAIDELKKQLEDFKVYLKKKENYLNTFGKLFEESSFIRECKKYTNEFQKWAMINRAAATRKKKEGEFESPLKKKPPRHESSENSDHSTLNFLEESEDTGDYWANRKKKIGEFESSLKKKHEDSDDNAANREKKAGEFDEDSDDNAANRRRKTVEIESSLKKKHEDSEDSDDSEDYAPNREKKKSELEISFKKKLHLIEDSENTFHEDSEGSENTIHKDSEDSEGSENNIHKDSDTPKKKKMTSKIL